MYSTKSSLLIYFMKNDLVSLIYFYLLSVLMVLSFLMLCSTNLATMQVVVTGATTDGDASDKIQKGILKMADSKAIGLLSLNSVVILGEC